LNYTYAGIGVYNPQSFHAFQIGDSFALGPWLRQAAARQQISAELYSGLWMDIGTPQRLTQLDNYLRNVSVTSEPKPPSLLNPIKGENS
jgi:MurNAc alpha-1-phosphate uridylyltransferase